MNFSFCERIPEKFKNYYLVTTPGKLIFNRILPKSFPYINEPTPTNLQQETPAKYFIAPGKNIPEKIKSLEIISPFKKNSLV